MNKLKKYYSWAFDSFYIVNRYARLHKYLKGKNTQTDNWKKKKKTLGTVEINVKMLWTKHFFIWSLRNWDFNNCENIVIIISVVIFSQNIYF